MALDTVRVPAADIVHLFQALAPGQLRGITWLAPVLLRLHELDQYEDAALVKAKVAALFTGFIRDPDGTVAGLNNGPAVNGVLQVGMEPGSLFRFRPAPISSFRTRPIPATTAPTSRTTSAPSRPGLVSPRAGLGRPRGRHLLLDPGRPDRVSPPGRAIAAQRGISVLPAGLGPVRTPRGALRRIACAGLRPEPGTYLACEWLPPKFDWVDPIKDVQAEIKAIRAGLKSRCQAIAERGYDTEEVDAAIAADRARAAGLGLALARPRRRSPEGGGQWLNSSYAAQRSRPRPPTRRPGPLR